MTQRERMEQGFIYDPGDQEIMDLQSPYLDRCWEFNQLRPSQNAEKEKYMKEVFAECGDNNYIELPFHANWGGAHLHLGSYVYANFNLTLVDDGHIYVGDRVLFGPNVTISTANHPLDSTLREKSLQYNKDVYIGNNTWIAANVVIAPGVHIGSNTVIGAGSVVTRDIPDNVIAVGSPCKVLREIGEHDRQYFYRNEEIDWENLV